MTTRYQKVIADLKTLGVDFRINDLNEALEVRMSQDDYFQELNDTMKAIIQVEMAELGYGVRGKKKPPISFFWDVATKRGNQQRYNPIKDYFDRIKDRYKPKTPQGQASPQPYAIPELASYFDNPDGYFSLWLFRWMVGLIAKIYQQERNPMLVLISEQRLGKSFFARWLCPLGDDYFLEGPINPDSKDARLRLADKILHEVGELGSTTRRADAEALKEFITKRFIDDRPPYAKMPIKKSTICSFIGSVNPDGAGFLNDPTGSTRFLSCQITHIRYDYTKLDKHQIWAEAFYFYQHSRQAWQLTPDEEQGQAQINAQFEIVNALDDVIEQFFEITGDENDFLTTYEIRQVLNIHYRYSNENTFNRDLARSMYRLGLTPGRVPFGEGQHRRGYRGIKRREQDKQGI